MALDEELFFAEDDGHEVWAPIHAWRALGVLRDPAGVPTLIEVMSHADEWSDDSSTGILPV